MDEGVEEEKTYGCHEHAKETAHAETHHSRHDRLAHTRLHGSLDLGWLAIRCRFLDCAGDVQL